MDEWTWTEKHGGTEGHGVWDLESVTSGEVMDTGREEGDGMGEISGVRTRPGDELTGNVARGPTQRHVTGVWVSKSHSIMSRESDTRGKRVPYVCSNLTDLDH